MRAKLLFIFILFSTIVRAQDDTVTAKVYFENINQPAKAIAVSVGGNIFYTDEQGIVNIPSNLVDSKSIIHIEIDDYFQVDLKLIDEMIIILQMETNEASTIALSLTDLESGDGDTESSPGLLFASGDAYSSISGYAWGPYWFRVRGYQSNYQKIFIDGIDMASAERGFASWSLWGGLNDVTRNKEVSYNLSPVNYGFSAIGGTTNIITSAAQQRPGLKASYSYSNGNYANRLMLTYSTGLSDKGWAMSTSVSRRWAQEGFVEGTSYDAWAGFLAIEKQFSQDHKLKLVGFVAPSTRGQQGGTVQEAYDLKETPYYNPNWGYQNGEKRNAREKTVLTPQFILKDEWKINDNLQLNMPLSFSFGKENRTALNWYDAPDPRPDYYRNLPSYQYDLGNDVAGDQLTELWKSDSFGQVNWDAMYQINYRSFEEVPVDWTDPDGVKYSGNRAHYIVENRVMETTQFQFNPTILWKVNDKMNVDGGLQYKYYNGNSYNSINDLLGADYYVDIDNFAERDFVDPLKALNDVDNPNIIRLEGDRIGHDYDSYIQTANAWAQSQRTFKNGSAYLGLQYTNTNMYRFGNRRKGLFPENSYGKSEVLNFNDYGVKLGGEYFLSGRNVFTTNLGYYTQAPYYVDSFVSLRTRNDQVANLVSSEIMSGDLNYYYRGQGFKARISGFYTQMNKMTDVISYYDDAYQNFVNYALTGIGQTNMGVEIGVEYNITSELRVKAAGTFASYKYNTNALASTTVDNSAEVIAENEVVYYNGRHVGGTPERAASIGVEYWSKNYWFVGTQLNYLGDRYVTLNPARYTDRAIDEPGVIFGSDQYYAILNQEKLPNALTLDFSAGKSWKIDDYLLRLNLNVNNALNNENIITTGYQQYRFDFVDGNPNKFANRYFYAQGLRVFLNLGFSF